MRTIGCPTQEQIAEFLAGRIPAPELEEIAAHLDICGRCEKEAQVLEPTADALVELLLRPNETDISFDQETQLRRTLLRIQLELDGLG